MTRTQKHIITSLMSIQRILADIDFKTGIQEIEKEYMKSDVTLFTVFKKYTFQLRNILWIYV